MPTTNYNPNFARSNFLREVSYYVPYYDSNVVELDPLSPEIHDFIERLTEFTDHSYIGEQLTTLCFQYHRCTTTVWIVLMVNGFLSRTELQPGMIIKFPTLNAINVAIREILQERFAKTQAFGSTIL